MDKYIRLKPFTDIEVCECEDVDCLLLVYMFTNNPINCFRCRKEIDPERLGITGVMCDNIARCFSVYGSLYRLWIDSGEYEEYAKKKLLDSKGEVNVLGMKLAKELSLKWPTYYWWFHDTDDGNPTHCPCCGNQLDEEVFWGTGKCDNCRVIV